MPPSTGLANTSKSIYGIYTTILSLNTTDIVETVCTPYYFNNNNGNPSLELWNVGNTSTIVNVTPVVKSIYDPSPAGFHIPNTGASQGWNENGRSYWQNTAGKQGRFFYQLGPTTGITVFFQLWATVLLHYQYQLLVKAHTLHFLLLHLLLVYIIFSLILVQSSLQIPMDDG